MMRSDQNLVVLEDTQETLHLVLPEFPEPVAGEQAIDEQAAGCIVCRGD